MSADLGRRRWLQLAGAGAVAAALGPRWLRAGHAAPRTNVLFIFVDDLRVQLGCYGHRLVRSPNLDRLAVSGTIFEQAYCQQAVCAPSRASVLSGRRPDSLGIYDLEHPLRQTQPDAVTLPQCFQSLGYRTISLGKVYHHGNDDRRSWDRLPPTPAAEYADPAVAADIKRRHAAALAKGLTGSALHNAARGPATECRDVPDETYRDGVIANTAIAELQQVKDQPFFMACGFIKPHLPFCSPKRYWDLYRREDFTVPERKPPADAPSIGFTNAGELRAYTDIPPVGPVDDARSRELIHGYHAAVSYTDAQVGKVLAELDRLGLAERTLVVVWGDHGWKLGEYGMWCKHTNFELDTHVPLLMRGPDIPAGQRVAAVVEMLDVYPTLVDLVGGRVPESCDGKSLRGVLAGTMTDWKNRAVSQYPRGQVMGYSLREGHWRYTQWVRKDGTVVAHELYDHSRSDVAAANLAARPEHAERVKALAQTLQPYLKTRWDMLPPPRRPAGAKR